MPNSLFVFWLSPPSENFASKIKLSYYCCCGDFFPIPSAYIVLFYIKLKIVSQLTPLSSLPLSAFENNSLALFLHFLTSCNWVSIFNTIWHSWRQWFPGCHVPVSFFQFYSQDTLSLKPPLPWVDGICMSLGFTSTKLFSKTGIFHTTLSLDHQFLLPSNLLISTPSMLNCS